MTTLARIIAATGLAVGAWLAWGARSRHRDFSEPIVRLAVKHPWATILAMLAGAVAAGGFALISGVVPIKASSGHWPITAALLDFAKTRSVATYSWGVQAPRLDDEAMIVRGAAHYETACLPCHGAPGRRMPPVMQAMTPSPPELTPRLARWAPEELFVIVKHGIKFTGMPAWPTQQREDEVWAMVAFLRRVPQLDAAGYQRLAHGGEPMHDHGGGTEPSAVVRNTCEHCHALDGLGRGAGAFPNLAGQRAEYLYESLKAFADQRRFSGIMSPVAAKLNEVMMREAADHYSRLPAGTNSGDAHVAVIARGRTIASRGIPERDIPACAECHGPNALPKHPVYPRLAGQHVRYLADQLRLLQTRNRGGTAKVNLMHSFVDRLRSEDIDAVTQFYGSL